MELLFFGQFYAYVDAVRVGWGVGGGGTLYWTVPPCDTFCIELCVTLCLEVMVPRAELCFETLC